MCGLVGLLAVAPRLPGSAGDVEWGEFLGRSDLVWDALGNSWTRGPFIGNGLIGAQIYHEPGDSSALRFDLSRSDLYCEEGGWYRVPSGHILLRPAGAVKRSRARLVLWDAEARGEIETDKGMIRWRSFAHADEPLIRIVLEATGGEEGARWEYVPERAMDTRKVKRRETLGPEDVHPEPVVTVSGDTTVAWQAFNRGGGAATAVREIEGKGTRTILATLAIGYRDASARDEARAIVTAPGVGDLERAVASHRRYWHAYYPASFLSVPDARLESFYWIQMYKLASATRANRPAVDLMGPWFQPSAWLAYWMNLNIQLTYWPVYAANHLELGESLVEMVRRGRDNLAGNVPEAWRGDASAIARATGSNLKGGVGKGGELGNLTFVMHNLWWQYRYSMDDGMLRDLVYPLLARCVNFYRHNLVRGDDGMYHLPLAISPEYEQKAEDCNYDLALLRWALQSLLWAADRLKNDDPAVPVWRDILARLAPYPVGEDGYLIGKGVPLAHSHRHFSHLFMVFPLGTVATDGPERGLVERSVSHWLGLEGAHAGYSFTGGAAMAAYLGDGNRALALMERFCDRYVRPNTMYYEGDQFSVIETPLSGARSLQEMLLQGHGGVLRIFPAAPSAWEDIAFRDLRAEGAFLVSAVRSGGRTRWVRIRSLAGEPCAVKVDIGSPVVTGVPPSSVRQRDGLLMLTIARGGEATIAAKGVEDFSVKPVARVGPDNPWGTVRKAPPWPISADASGCYTFAASAAAIAGEKLFYEKGGKKDNLGRWIDPADYAHWRGEFPSRRAYRVLVTYGAGNGRFAVVIGDERIEAEVRPTGGPDAPKEFELGTVTVPAGVHGVEIRAVAFRGYLMNFRSIRLVPR